MEPGTKLDEEMARRVLGWAEPEPGLFVYPNGDVRCAPAVSWDAEQALRWLSRRFAGWTFALCQHPQTLRWRCTLTRDLADPAPVVEEGRTAALAVCMAALVQASCEGR